MRVRFKLVGSFRFRNWYRRRFCRVWAFIRSFVGFFIVFRNIVGREIFYFVSGEG